MMFDFLSLAHVTQCDDLHYHPFSCRDIISFFLMAEKYSVVHLSGIPFLQAAVSVLGFRLFVRYTY
jgi:hypothetical protein